MKNKKITIYAELTMLLLIAACIVAAFFSVINMTGDYLITQYLESTDYINRREQEQAEDLQDYVNQNHISTDNIQKLDNWIQEQRNSTIQVFYDGVIIYDSYYPEDVGTWEITDESYFEREGSYQIQLEDDSVYVSIYGFYMYRFYDYVFVVELILSAILFVLIVLTGIQKKIQYIRKLHEEIKLLEGGNLDYQITIAGKDELTELATGLDAMRQSLRQQIEEETRLMDEHRSLVTEMSHDLRTPLTSLLIYTEILKKNGAENQEQVLNYVDKINQKAHQLKILSDHIFQYSLVSSEIEVKMDEAEEINVVFYDILSEIAVYLKQQGFEVVQNLEWEKVKICVNQEYLSRVFDNIVSNIIKYADPTVPIWITSLQNVEGAGMCFENRIRKSVEDAQSTQIGLRSLENMMRKMEGWSKAEKGEEDFRLELWFRKV